MNCAPSEIIRYRKVHIAVLAVGWETTAVSGTELPVAVPHDDSVAGLSEDPMLAMQTKAK